MGIRNKTDTRQIPLSIWILGFVSLLMDISSELIHSLLPVFLTSVLGASAFTVGFIEGVAEAAALIAKMFSGTLSDYLGKRKLLAVIGYGLAALSKPLFAIATSTGMVFTARFLDRIGKGIRGAPRDALVADIAPSRLRGAAYGLRQSLDTAGAFIGPLLAIGLMLLWSSDIRAIFQVAVIPAVLAVTLLFFGVHEPNRQRSDTRINPIDRRELGRLSNAYWWVVGVGAIFTLARFSEAFLIIHTERGGLPMAWVPLVLVAMNLVYALSAYPFGKLSDSVSHARLLALGLVVLIGADLVLAAGDSILVIFLGVCLWGLHLGITQGLLARMVADNAPEDLRGTAFGIFNLLSGLAILTGNIVAGILWDRLGSSSTFYAGSIFGLATLATILIKDVRDRAGSCH